MFRRISWMGAGLFFGFIFAQVIPGAFAWQDSKAKAPEWKGGSILAVRKQGEPEVGPGTKRVGVEVYRDETTNHWIFVSETGDIAVSPVK